MGLRVGLLARLLAGSQPHRGSTLEDKAHPEEDPCPHQGCPDRGDGLGTGSGECQGRRRVLRSLRIPRSGAAVMKDAVGIKISAPEPWRIHLLWEWVNKPL